ncbi:MAG TPA: FAD-dependent monooxygenase [Acidobacteriaceae bacterium]|nr:FAD-dependent monooxygenase [Acidobacteriaceae bacterium]
MVVGQKSCDVLIAGGGPAGLAAAIALRQRGADVLVADALRPPIDKPCGEGLMPDSRRELARLGVQVDDRLGARFSGILFADGDAQVKAEFPQGAGIGVRRPVLHQLLLDRAAELGVRMAWNAPVVMKEQNAALVGGERCGFRWLVGADGHASRVRAWAGLDAANLRSRRFGFRAHFRIAPWSSYVEIHWGAQGQVYVTPVGPHEICVAAISRRSDVRLKAVIDSIPFLRKKLAGAAVSSAERGALTLTRRLHRVTRGNVALVGDASGSADAITGEGLAMAFRQALLLAESLEQGGLHLYESRHGSILALPQQMATMMLLLDRHAWLRRRALPVLAARPELFRAMLAVHVGEASLPNFLAQHGLEFGALLLAPQFA